VQTQNLEKGTKRIEKGLRNVEERLEQANIERTRIAENPWEMRKECGGVQGG
jgi:hypothetical protein